MQFILSSFIFSILAFALFSEQATVRTDEYESQEEEVQLIEEADYDPAEDEGRATRPQLEIDQEISDQYVEDMEAEN